MAAYVTSLKLYSLANWGQSRYGYSIWSLQPVRKSGFINTEPTPGGMRERCSTALLSSIPGRETVQPTPLPPNHYQGTVVDDV